MTHLYFSNLKSPKSSFFFPASALYLLVTWDADGIALVQGFGVDGWTSMI